MTTPPEANGRIVLTAMAARQTFTDPHKDRPRQFSEVRALLEDLYLDGLRFGEKRARAFGFKAGTATGFVAGVLAVAAALVLTSCGPARAAEFPRVTEATCFEKSFHFLSHEVGRLYFWSETSGTVRVYQYVEGQLPGSPMFEVEAATCVEAKSFVCIDMETVLEQSLGCP